MRTKKLIIIVAVAVMSLGLMGCHEYNHRYSGTVVYGWDSDPYYYPGYRRYPRYYRHHRRHHHHW